MYDQRNGHTAERARTACSSETKDAILDVIARRCEVTGSSKRLLLCGLTGDVTKEENMVENCVELALLLNRTLVKPQPQAAARDTWAHLDDGDAVSQLWDFEAFAQYARMRGVCLVGTAPLSEAERRPSLRADLQRWAGERTWKFTRLQANGFVAETFSAELPSTSAAKGSLLAQLHAAGPVVLAAHPFQTLVQSGAAGYPHGLHCCSAAESIRARAGAIWETQPASYDCLI